MLMLLLVYFFPVRRLAGIMADSNSVICFFFLMLAMKSKVFLKKETLLDASILPPAVLEL